MLGKEQQRVMQALDSQCYHLPSFKDGSANSGSDGQKGTQDGITGFQVHLRLLSSDMAAGPARPGFLAPLGYGQRRRCSCLCKEVQLSVQGPLTVPILGLGSQRWRRNEIMLFFISSAKKIFHLLPVRDARFSNKRMAVSLTSSCSCDDRCMSLVSPPHGHSQLETPQPTLPLPIQ